MHTSWPSCIAPPRNLMYQSMSSGSEAGSCLRQIRGGRETLTTPSAEALASIAPASHKLSPPSIPPSNLQNLTNAWSNFDQIEFQFPLK